MPTTEGRKAAVCSANRSTDELAARAKILKRSGKCATTRNVFCPIEPVDPIRASFFMRSTTSKRQALRKKDCPAGPVCRHGREELKRNPSHPRCASKWIPQDRQAGRQLPLRRTQQSSSSTPVEGPICRQ